MTSETQKATTRRWILGIWDKGEFGLIDDLAASDRYVYKVPGQESLRGQSFRDFVSTVRAAFPDLRNTIETQVSEGDLVVTRGTTRGTHRGSFLGVAPTEKTVEVPWVIITLFEGGRIAEDWEIYDGLGLMTQLGAIPAVAQAS